jgi:homoserine dehydrogenase
MKKGIGIGLLGMGVVGGGVARVLVQKADFLARQTGCPLSLRKVLVRQLEKKRPLELDPQMLTTRADDVLEDEAVDIIVEAIGGESPALEYIRGALQRGKSVVTANKEVMAKYGPELLGLARHKGVDLRFEASVGGGIPLIAPFQQDILANSISAIYAIINGTSNYILTRMAHEGIDFSQALKSAQELGYAEPDPTNDIEGIDASYKLAILTSLAFQTAVRPEDVYREGISRLAGRDFRYARELGYAIRLLAIAKRDEGSLEVRVHPVLLPEDYLLAKVDGVYNAVQVEGDLFGKLLFYGQGAGALPTSSAVMADIIAVAQRLHRAVPDSPRISFDQQLRLKPMAEIRPRYYLRMNVADSPGVLAQISRILGDNIISISSVIQKEADRAAQTAEIVIMTHPALERDMQRALDEMERLAEVKEVSNFLRVEV